MPNKLILKPTHKKKNMWQPRQAKEVQCQDWTFIIYSQKAPSSYINNSITHLPSAKLNQANWKISDMYICQQAIKLSVNCKAKHL